MDEPHTPPTDEREAMPSASCFDAARGQIRFIGDMQRVNPEPGDVFVLHCEQDLSEALAKQLGAMATSALNGAKVIVLGKGMKLELVASHAPAEVVVHNTVGNAASDEVLAGLIAAAGPARRRGDLR